MSTEKNFDKWNEIKKSVQEKPDNFGVHEREIWWCSLGANIGSEQDGTGRNFDRPIVIVRGFNKNVFFAVALTGKGREASAVLSQVRLMDTKRLVRKIGVLDERVFGNLKIALSKALFGDK